MAEDITKNPLYIGATNFANLQKQYTANQIEQSTTRDASGNILWKEGVNIADIPKTAPAATIIPPTTTDMPNTSDLLSGGSVNLKDLTSGTSTTDMAAARNAVAESALSGISYQYDALLAQQQAAVEKKKSDQEMLVQNEKSYLTPSLVTQKRSQALASDRKLFEVEENVRLLGDIRSQIAADKSALEQGIIYEQSRPVRQSLLQGRTAELQSQGVAKINALNATAAVVQGNIDLAASYAKATQDAIEGDYQEQRDAINTLLDLDEKALVRLTDEEKGILDTRNKLIEQTILQNQKNVDDVFTLIQSAPAAAADGKVSFSDSLETALGKMLPFMSDRDKLMFQAELDSKNRTNRGGSGSGTSEVDRAKILKGMTEAEKKAYAGVLDELKGKTQAEILAYLQENEKSLAIKLGSDEAFLMLMDDLGVTAEGGGSLKDQYDTLTTTTEKLSFVSKNKEALIAELGKDGYRELLTDAGKNVESESVAANRQVIRNENVDANFANNKSIIGKVGGFIKNLFVGK